MLGVGEVWERCGRVYGVSVEGVGKCVGVWGRVKKSGGGVEKCVSTPHFSLSCEHPTNGNTVDFISILPAAL